MAGKGKGLMSKLFGGKSSSGGDACCAMQIGPDEDDQAQRGDDFTDARSEGTGQSEDG
ncbi:hypothetical protein [Saccharomonospora sp. CUA-673]|uniref:hypothetical protein n=1 Tax=Saccharomonospora sp. CUA-673 TaxID=1904969 RepID=UPI0013010C3D|nr:hypothetical protein [Saccharomonospora sp. CUA-673]